MPAADLGLSEKKIDKNGLQFPSNATKEREKQDAISLFKSKKKMNNEVV